MSKLKARNRLFGNLIKRGLKYQRAGRPGLAEACYRRSLKFNPRGATALHLLGLLAQQAGKPQESMRWLAEALALPAGEDHAETLTLLARTYFDQGQISLAHQSYQRLADLLPQSAMAHLRLGTTQEWLADWDAAEVSYRRALDLQPNSPDIHGSLARLQCKLGNWGEAVASCRRALGLNPGKHEIYNLLGYALINAGQLSAAAEIYRCALLRQPNSANSIHGLGFLLERQGDLNCAAQAFRLALQFNPQLPDAHLHLGIVDFIEGDLAKAAEYFKQVLALAPNHAEARAFLGHIHLLQGDFRRGWCEHEYRWQTAHFLRNRRLFPQPLWTGEPLSGTRILLHAEQGLGDTIQFVRYAPLVAARGANVVLEVQPRLRRLLAPAPGVVSVVCRGEALPEFDCQCPLLSLPRVFATDLGSIPADIPYIHPDPSQVAVWGRRLAGHSLRIGLAWAGSPSFPHERWRGIPLEKLAPLTFLEGATFYSLQMGPATAQIAQMGTRLRLIDLQNEQDDLADTAAIVANLELVISVDTSIAHLAGALGKPVWVLLHKSPDWRWLLDRDDSPWYPTARLFRQTKLGKWNDVITRVEQELRRFIAVNGRPQAVSVLRGQAFGGQDSWK